MEILKIKLFPYTGLVKCNLTIPAKKLQLMVLWVTTFVNEKMLLQLTCMQQVVIVM